jgi:Xaa-Pro aminopeptidase
MSGCLDRVPPALRAAGLAGWLFYNIYHRDHVADAILGVAPDTMNTRPWACLVRADGTVQRIVHAIEARVLDHLPGPVARYASRDEFLQRLRAACRSRLPVALNYSATIPALSLVDHGLASLLRQLAIPTVSAETLIQRVLGVLDPAARASHDRAATALRTILAATWQRLAQHLRSATPVSEGTVRDWIVDGFREHGLVTEEPPLVAAGGNSSDPHYQPAGAGAPIAPRQVVQFDLWAKEPAAGAVYADISWVGVAARQPTARQRDAFAAVLAARERAVTFLEDAARAGRTVSGSDVDRACRQELAERDLLSAVRHRTGHSIDTDLHGSGVNLDSFEFPDERPVTEGACFSVEPGVYFPGEFGMRTEIDVSIRCGRPVASGGPAQEALLSLP